LDGNILLLKGRNKESYMGREKEEEDVNSYKMASVKRDDTGN
jgi:hypothetical protein